jgi:hypothetical protein
LIGVIFFKILDLLKIQMTTLMMHYTIHQKLISWIYLYVPIFQYVGTQHTHVRICVKVFTYPNQTVFLLVSVRRSPM